MKTYLVTGGAGFIGSNLAGRLVQQGHRVHVIDDLSTGYLRNIPKEVIFHHVDISRMDELLSLDLPVDIDAIYHMAGQSSGEASFDNPIHDINANYIATYNIMKLAEKRRCRRFIYASSMSVYGEVSSTQKAVDEQYPCNPSSYYGCNKLASEKMISIFTKKTDIKPTLFRFFNVYGPGQNMKNMKQGMASIYMSYLMRDVPVIVKGSLERFRDFIYVDDLVDVLIKSELCEKMYGDVFNVGTGRTTTVLELIQSMLKAFGKKDFKLWVVVEGNTPGDIRGFAANISKLKAALGWVPEHNIEQGILKMKQWIYQTIDIWKD